MKKLLLFACVALFFMVKLEAKKIEGQIIYENESVTVTMKIPVNFLSQEPNYEKLQNRIKYIDAFGAKQILRPDDALEINFRDGGEMVRMLSREKTDGMGHLFSTSSKIFLRLEIDGDLKLFNYYYTQRTSGTYNAATGMTTGGMTYSVEKYILQKGNGELKRPKGLTFRKDMIEYFSDCPELASRIENKEYRNNDLESIVYFYNNSCK